MVPVVAEVCLYWGEDCWGSYILWGSRGTRSQEGAWLGQMTWSSQKDIAYHTVSWPVYKRGVGPELSITAQWWAGHRSANGEQLFCASLISLQFYSSLSPFHYNYYYSLFWFNINVSLSQPTRFMCFCFYSPSGRGGMSKQLHDTKVASWA